MKKGLLILVLFLVLFIASCTTPQEQTALEAPPQAVGDQFEIEGTAVNETPVSEEELVDETTVKEEPQEEPAEVPDCTRQFLPMLSSGPHYTGPLFDAHFHMPNLIERSEIPEGHRENYGDDHGSSVSDPVLGKDAQLDSILCNFDKENVKGVIGFVIGAEEVLDKTLKRSWDIKERSSGKINLFLMPYGFSTENLEKIQETEMGLFSGYGEIAFYHPSYTNIPPDSPTVMEQYKVAGKNNLIVMIHPAGRQKAQVENAVKNNPNVKFLIHGPEAEDYITSLMDRYPNVYYSIDAVLARIPPAPAALMYMVSGKEEFKVKFNKNFDLMLDESEKSWKAKVEKYPDRFMWGTDRGDLWTYEEDVSVLLEEFSRAFIGRLNPAVQEKFAYKNAEALLS